MARPKASRPALRGFKLCPVLLWACKPKIYSASSPRLQILFAHGLLKACLSLLGCYKFSDFGGAPLIGFK